MFEYVFVFMIGYYVKSQTSENSLTFFSLLLVIHRSST